MLDKKNYIYLCGLNVFTSKRDQLVLTRIIKRIVFRLIVGQVDQHKIDPFINHVKVDRLVLT